MASKISVSTFPFSPSPTCSRLSPSTSSSSSILYPRTPKFHLSLCNFPLGLRLFSPWTGLKHLGISTRGRSPFPERRKRIPKGKAVFASLFGVGAPEALVIGVVALLVFGPKGLAEVARTLGKTLRAFQPTIRELQDVSREFKTTLEREIGLDEIESSVNSSYNASKSTYSNPPSVSKAEELSVAEPNDFSSASKAYSSEEYLKVTEEQLKAQGQLQTDFAAQSQSGSQVQREGTVEELATVAPELQNLETGKVEESTTSAPGPSGTET
ncbi:sec-independent protein translocase protein TATB, chloroplastic isoform X2 [Cucumis melo]|uniref:Sec-independent protein translocase protein TATB, chloroplastic isoform X2 n=1 Tax=Cucumis melo TaxID=3656 RepID=A0A1S3AYD4_CUCME|nr:sec-independent protein translocase protein TATB, chloroplastic isoform X2 [Cucumis melo]